MFPFRKILFPVDYSEPCEGVVPYVKEMVRHFSADLTMVHAYGPDAVALSAIPLTDPDLAADLQADQEQRLRDFAGRTFAGQHVECFSELGEAGSVVDKVIQHQGADLVMLATHGRGPIRRLLLGSVAAKLLHDVSAAVWTGSGAAFSSQTPPIPYRSILCALDDSDEAAGVLKAAAAFACSYKAQLALVQVVEIPGPTPQFDYGPFRQNIMDAAHSRLRELKGSVGIDAPHAVIDAFVADGVREEALRRKADLIVTGRGHAQATFSRIWSHVYPIVRESPCPVLSI